MPDVKRTSDRLKRLYNFIICMAIAVCMMVQPALAADTIWSKLSSMMADIYGEILGISTIVAVVAASIALVVRMVSRNQRAVDEASSWLKRIIITWVILNTLGFIVAYISPLVEGGKYTG